MRHGWALLGVLLLPTAAWPAVVLIPLDGPRQVAEPAAAAIVEALRSSGIDVRLGGLPLDDARLATNCMEENAQCFRKIMSFVDANALLIGEALDKDGTIGVNLRHYGVDGALLGESEGDIAGVGQSDRVKAAQPLLAALGFEAITGILLIDSAEDGVTVWVDREHRGVTPIRVEQVPPGQHLIQAQKDGFSPWRSEVVVKVGVVTSVEITLEGAPPASAPGVLSRLRARTWYAAAASGAFFFGGFVFGTLTLSAQDDVDNAPVDTHDDFFHLQDRASRGESYALAANILYGIGAASLVAAGILAYMDLSAPLDNDSTITISTGGLGMKF